MTYIKHFFGTPEAVEAAVRTFDQVFRMRYNVYGGHREGTYYTEDGDYNVIMAYTADFGDMGGLFPEYSALGIDKTFYYWMRRHPLNEDFGSNNLVLVKDLKAWREGR